MLAVSPMSYNVPANESSWHARKNGAEYAATCTTG